jgi:hypothetical protein
MRQAAVLADRRQAIRDEAQEWLKSGWIDESASGTVARLYPDDRVRTGPAFRILFFLLTLAAIAAFLGVLYSQVDGAGTIAALALVVGGICFAATEYLVNESRRRQGGIEAAVSVAAVVNLIIGVAVLVLEFWKTPDRTIEAMLFLVVGLLLGAAAWMWGYWPYAAFSSASIFGAVIGVSGGRFLYLVAVTAACWWMIPLGTSERLPPSLRKSVTAFWAVAIAALYAGVNVYLFDQRYFTHFQRAESFPRWLSIVLTALLPCAVFLIGLVRRQRLLMVLGFGFGMLSLAILRIYVHVTPAWVVLVASGIALLALAGSLRRYLDSGSNSERAGFTVRTLTDQPDKLRAAEIIATLGTMTPQATVPAEQSGFHGGGGDFGGGGASGKF